MDMALYTSWAAMYMDFFNNVTVPMFFYLTYQDILC